MPKWTVGQRVLRYNAEELATVGVVAEVLKMKVKLEDGSQWRHDGGLWGSDQWSRICIAAASEEMIVSELARTRVRRMRGWHGRVDWKLIPIEVLEQTYALLHPAQEAALRAMLEES